MNTVTRREMMSVMAGGALSRFRPPSGPAALKFVRLNHIDFFVSDVEKSKRFFGPIFQFPVKQQNGKWYVWLGSGYLQFGMPADRNGDTGAAIKSLQKFGAKDVRISTDTSGLGPQPSGPPPKILTFSDADGMTDGFRFQIIGGY